MEYEATVSAEVTAERRGAGKNNTLEDVLYTIMGDASISSLLVMIFAILFFGGTPIIMLLIFGTYSGGMRWLITLGIVAVMGFVAIYLMKHGIKSPKKSKTVKDPQTEFPGQLTGLTETVGRAKDGYVYSQQLLRERLCDALLDKLSVIRDLDREEMVAMLEKGDTRFVGDEFLGKFLLTNRREAGNWDDARLNAKGKSADRGKKFMLEIEIILERMEAIV